MDRRSMSFAALVVTVVLVLGLPAGAMAKGRPPVTETTNNLSFPAIAVDGFGIAPLATTSFSVPYAGDYPGLTVDEIAALQTAGPWYPQKTDGNAWQADFAAQTAEAVTYVDWGTTSSP